MSTSDSDRHSEKLTETSSPSLAGMSRRSAMGVVGAVPVLGGCGESREAAAEADMFHARFRQAARTAVSRPLLDKVRETVSVKDFGAVGDGKTDDTTAIQAALSSGARKVIFPAGRYVTGPLQVPDWLHIQGAAYQPSIGADGRATELSFKLKTGSGLSCGLNPVIQNLFFQNTGGTYDQSIEGVSGTTAQAILLSENAVIEDCCFSLWNECVRTGDSTFYLKTSRLNFNRCTYGYRSVSAAPYNLHIDAPHSAQTRIFIAGNLGGPPRNVKIFGGSIEGYECVAQQVLDISFFGTYFETEAPRTGVVGIKPGLDHASVALFGCLIYMTRTKCFVDMSGLNGAALTSVGNVYDGSGSAGSVCLALPEYGSATLSGDRFGTKHAKSCLYLDSVTAAAKFNVVFPLLPDGHEQAAYSTMQMVGPRGIIMKGLTAEPANKPTGMSVMADGAGWDPLGRRVGRPYWVIWQGDRWAAFSG